MQICPELPRIESVQQLALWLRLSADELDWYRDVCGNTARSVPAQTLHYRQVWIAKRQAGRRLLEIPKVSLKRIQRRLLDEMLGKVPLAEQAKGFVAGRSCLDHARAHVGREWLVTLDLKDWFGRISRARVAAQFRYLGYPPPVALALAQLTTTRTPPAVIEQAAAIDRMSLRTPHLPQGAPTSPVLANLVTARLDRRLAGYARFAGLDYSRYADDIALSPQPGAQLAPQRAVDAVCRLAASEGFAVNPRKIHVNRVGERMSVCGILINERLNLARERYDLLRAQVHRYCRSDAADHSPEESQQLRGRLAWLAQLNPRRAARLIAQVDAWEGAGL